MLRIKNRVIVVVLFTASMFFIFRQASFIGVSTVSDLSSFLVYPFLRIQKVIVEPINIWLGRCATIQELERVIELAQKEKNDLLAENVSLKAMHCYANDTRDLRDFNKRYLLKKGRIVHVLARHSSSNNQFFLMDAGSQQGIKKDMIALYCNAIVGRVCEVYPWYCKVYLITDAECKVAAMCEGTGASGIHEGLNDDSYTTLRHVSHLEKIVRNGMVLSAGEGLVFPRGFALGKIESADKGDLFYLIKIKPIVNFNTLSYCTLIAKDEIENISLK